MPKKASTNNVLRNNYSFHLMASSVQKMSLVTSNMSTVMPKMAIIHISSMAYVMPRSGNEKAKTMFPFFLTA